MIIEIVLIVWCAIVIPPMIISCIIWIIDFYKDLFKWKWKRKRIMH